MLLRHNMRQIAIKIDVFGPNGSFHSNDWLLINQDNNLDYDTNLTSAVQHIRVTKQNNSSFFGVELLVSPARGKDNKTWKDRLSLLDVVTITSRVSDEDGVKEHVLFFGFITDKSNSINVGDVVKQYISISCESIGLFMNNPFLAFDKLVDPFAGLLGVSKDVWDSLQKLSLSGSPAQIIEGLIERFKAYLNPIYIQSKFGEGLLKDYLNYDLRTVGEVLPFNYAVPNALAGYSNNFWTAFSSAAEVFNGVGWLHELRIDILSSTKLNRYIELMDNNGYTGVHSTTWKALPVSGTENWYLILMLRPNIFPYLDTAVENKSTLVNTIALNEIADKINFHNELWESFSGDLLHHHNIEVFSAFNSNQNINNMKTVFQLGSSFDITQSLDYNLPVFVDLENYNKFGFNPLRVDTRYTQITEVKVISGQETNRPDLMQNLARLNLRMTSYNTLMDLYEHGSITIPYNPDISVGDLCSVTEMHQTETLMFHVGNVAHEIDTQSGVCVTILNFDRGLLESQWKNLETLLMDRLVVTQTVGMKQALENKGINPKTGDLVGESKY